MEGWGPLLVAVLAMLLLRGLGMALAWRLPAGHPAILWAAAVSEAALSAWVVLALVSPGPWPVVARVAGAGAGLAVFLLCGRRLMPGLAVGLGVIWGVDLLLR
ncbi:hypothetical protein [Roseomonas sp. WA12]